MAEVVAENRHGDPRYLNEARKALADQRKLWGLDAPQQLEIRPPRNPYDGMSEEALQEQLAQHARLLASPISEAAATDTVRIPIDEPVIPSTIEETDGQSS